TPSRGARTMTRLTRAAAVAAVAAAALLVTRAAIPAAAPAREKAKDPLDQFRFVAFDGFDGQLRLNWQPRRHDPTHVSLKKHPGKLTIVTQKGTIHAQAEKNEANGYAKNIFVIDNPLAKNADFVVTTCVVDFKPEASYHQA